MKDKKGFTLIELIVTIALLAILGTIIAVNLVSLNKKQQEKENARMESIIASATEAYLKSENKTASCILVETLVDKGYLKKSSITEEYQLGSVSINADSYEVYKSSINCSNITTDKRYYVYYYDENKKLARISNQTYTSGTTIKLSDYSKTGYTLKGWKTKKTANKTLAIGSEYIINKNTKLFADWQIDKYTVKFDYNYDNISTSKKYEYNTNIEFPALEREGYTFLGWSTKQNATKATYKASSTVKAKNDIIYYAVWERSLYDVKLIANNGKVYSPITLKDQILSQDIQEQDENNFAKKSDDLGLFKLKVDGNWIYYFRGKVDNNYINFAGLRWRIFGINSDNSVKLVLDRSQGNAKYSYLYLGNDDTYMGLTDFYNVYLRDYDYYIVDSPFCLSLSNNIDITTALACNQSNQQKLMVNTTNDANKLDNPIGILSYYDLIISGYSSDWRYTSSYLSDIIGSNNMLLSTYTDKNKTRTYSATNTSIAKPTGMIQPNSVYPVINLNGNMNVKGDGTQGNPYVLVDDVDTSAEDSEEAQVDVNGEISFNVVPDYNNKYESISCTNNQSASYDEETNKVILTNVSNDTVCTIDFKEKKYVMISVSDDEKEKYESYVENIKDKYPDIYIDLVTYGGYKIKKYAIPASSPKHTEYYFNTRVVEFLGILGKYAVFLDNWVSDSGTTHAYGNDYVYLRKYNDTNYTTENSGYICYIYKFKSRVPSFYFSREGKTGSITNSKAFYMKIDADTCYFEYNPKTDKISVSYAYSSVPDFMNVGKFNYGDLVKLPYLNTTSLYAPYYDTSTCASDEKYQYLLNNYNSYLKMIKKDHQVWYTYENHPISDGNNCGIIVQLRLSGKEYTTYSLWYDDTVDSDQKLLFYYNNSENYSNKYLLLITHSNFTFNDVNSFNYNYFNKKTTIKATGILSENEFENYIIKLVGI